MSIQESTNKTVSKTGFNTSDVNYNIKIKEITNAISSGLNILNNAIIENYDLDEEVNKEGILNKDSIDFSRIATSSANAKNGDFIVIKNTKYWGDTDELTYKIRDDGTVAIMENGIVLGFTQ